MWRRVGVILSLVDVVGSHRCRWGWMWASSKVLSCVGFLETGVFVWPFLGFVHPAREMDRQVVSSNVLNHDLLVCSCGIG